MPQPLSGIYSCYSHPDVLPQRPDHCVGIALIAQQWAALETNLINVFTHCLFEDRPDDRQAGHIARTAWQTLDSLKARLSLLDAIAQERIPANLLKEFREKVVPEVRSRARERNRVVHAFWYCSDKYPDDLILLGDSPEEHLRYSVKEFHQIADRIQLTARNITNFLFRVQAQIAPKPQTPPPQPLP